MASVTRARFGTIALEKRFAIDEINVFIPRSERLVVAFEYKAF